MKFEASTFSEHGSLVMKLNSEIIIHNSGKISINIEPDRVHTVSWEVKGKPGTSYTISISSPPSAEFHLRKVIGKGGTDSYQFQFET